MQVEVLTKGYPPFSRLEHRCPILPEGVRRSQLYVTLWLSSSIMCPRRRTSSDIRTSTENASGDFDIVFIGNADFALVSL